MLLANIATANHIYRKFPQLALLRRHPPPKAKMVDELQELCDQLGLDIDLSSAGALHVSTCSKDTTQYANCLRKYDLPRIQMVSVPSAGL